MGSSMAVAAVEGLTLALIEDHVFLSGMWPPAPLLVCYGSDYLFVSTETRSIDLTFCFADASNSSDWHI